MKRQVRLLLTRLSTNLHSRSIRGVARTLAIVALLFVSLLIVGADAFAQGGVIPIYGGDWCPPCKEMKRNLKLPEKYYGPAEIKGQKVEFVDATKAGYKGPIPAAVINGKPVVGEQDILAELQKGADKKKKEEEHSKKLEHWCCKNKHQGEKGATCEEPLNASPADPSSPSGQDSDVNRPSAGPLCGEPIDQKCPGQVEPKVKPGENPNPPSPPAPAPAPPGGGGGGGGGNPLGGMMQALPQLLGAMGKGGQQGQQGQQSGQSSDAGRSSDAQIIEMALAAQTAAAQATAVAQATAIAQATAVAQATAMAQATAEAQANAIAQATDAPDQSVYVPISGWDEATSEDSAVSAGGGSSQIQGAATPRSGLSPDSKF